MQDWLLDFDARPLTDNHRQVDQNPSNTGRLGFKGKLYNTEAFLDAIPAFRQLSSSRFVSSMCRQKARECAELESRSCKGFETN